MRWARLASRTARLTSSLRPKERLSKLVEPTTVQSSIDDENLGVNHGGLVLVDLGAGLEERAVGAAAGAAGEHVIGLAAGHEDADLDVALFDGAAELVA